MIYTFVTKYPVGYVTISTTKGGKPKNERKNEMKEVIIHFMHQFENEVYQNKEEAAIKVFEYVTEGFPIRASIYDKESDTLCITFGCKGSIILED